jgi:Flp pilus assembly pilin Flp
VPEHVGLRLRAAKRFEAVERGVSMARWKQRVARFLHQQDGLTSVEYGFMAVLILVACIVAVTLFGQTTNSVFEKDVTKIIGGS